jgi:septum formation inhibitor MinC
MDAALVIAADPDDSRPAAVLRGNARGLEIVVDGRATIETIATAVTARLGEAPAFFRGSDVRIRVEDGPLPTGCLSRLDDVAARFELRIVAVVAGADPAVPWGPDPQVQLPLPPQEPPPLPAPPLVEPLPRAPQEQPSPDQLELALRALEPEIEIVEEIVEPPGPRVVVGPIRSGVIFEHRGHVIVFGDVNPGAEIRAEGNIVVLGRLRGTAHAAIGRDSGFILALRLEPQQLRISRTVARAGDKDKPGTVPEIAHVAGGNIVVERYLGRLPGGLAHSI